MKTGLLVRFTILLYGSLKLALARGNGAAQNLAAQTSDKTYPSSYYGFQLGVPEDWTARETNFYVAHYNRVFLTVNSQRPDLIIQNWPPGGTTQEFGASAAFEQMRPGEVYVSIGYIGYPGPETIRSDTVGDDLRPLLATNAISPSGQPGLSGLDLHFFKRGYWWEVTAWIRDTVTEEHRHKLFALLQSFRFVDGPVGNAAWAESLAWVELPEQIRGGNSGPSPLGTFDWSGWPVVELAAEQTGYATFGSRMVVASKTSSGFLIKFILQNAGVWEYFVLADGEVQAKSPMVYAIGPPASELPSDLPGESQGKLNVHWVAPGALVSSLNVTPMVTWFTKDGSVKRQVRASGPDAGYGFIEVGGPPATIRGINEDWELTLPKEPADAGLAGYITGTSDSRVFFHEHHPKQGLVALDIYFHGRLTNTVGPFVQYPLDEFALNEDGSAGLLIWKDESKDTGQIVTLNSEGRLRIRVDCGPAVWSPIVAPGGAGALVRPNTGGSNQNTFTWFTGEGKVRSMEISPNPYCPGWIPESEKSLFSTSIGNDDYRYQLIDWGTGRRLWNIPCPGGGRQPLAVGCRGAIKRGQVCAIKTGLSVRSKVG